MKKVLFLALSFLTIQVLGAAPFVYPTYSTTAAAPGDQLIIVGNDLCSITEYDSETPYADSLNGVEVTVGDMTAPILYTSPNVVVAIVPWLESGESSELLLTNANGTTAPFSVYIKDASPSIWTWDETNIAFGGTPIKDVYIGPGSPAHCGEEIFILATGLGGIADPHPAGSVSDKLDVELTHQAEFVFDDSIATPVTGLSPHETHFGYYTVRMVIPKGLSPGTHSVKLRIGSEASTPTQIEIAPERRIYNMGFSTVPNDEDIAYFILNNHADIVCHTFQFGVPWVEALNSDDVNDYPIGLQASLYNKKVYDNVFTPNHDYYIVANPIDSVHFDGLAEYWSGTWSTPLPEPWTTYAFNHPNVKQAYLNYCKALIDYFQPKYFSPNMEANILLCTRPTQWGEYLELHEFIYDSLKAEYPDLKLVCSVHYEYILGLHTKARELVESVGESYPDVLINEVRNLLQHADIFALSTFPHMVLDNEVGYDYYDQAVAIARELKIPLAIDQTGFNSVPVEIEELFVTLAGSEALQAQHMEILLTVAQQQQFEFLINFVTYDYGTLFGDGPIERAWAYSGLYNEDIQPKAVMFPWLQRFNMPLEVSP